MMKRYLPLLLALCVFGCTERKGGIVLDDDWSSYTTANGLAYPVVAGLELAPDGSLWCTHPVEGGGGISRFGGSTWTHFTSADGLASDVLLWLESLACTMDGTLWAGTYDAGLSRYDGTTWTTYTTADGLFSDTIHALAAGPDGEVWCAGPGISRLHGENWTTFTSEQVHLGEFGAMSIAVAQNGDVRVGGLGLSRFDGVSWHDHGDDHGLQVGPVMAIAVATDGSIWVGGDGVTSFDGATWTHFTLAEIGVTQMGDLGVTSLAYGIDGSLWVGTDLQGIIKYDGTTWTRFDQQDGLVHDSVLSIAVAPGGEVWVGTMGGLSRYSPD